MSFSLKTFSLAPPFVITSLRLRSVTVAVRWFFRKSGSRRPALLKASICALNPSRSFGTLTLG